MKLDNVALIPARGGSVGVPRKNVKLLGSKPLIAYTIDAALNAESVNDVYVTTEDPEIAEISRKYGAKILDRPLPLSQDYVQTGEVFLYSLRQLQHMNIWPKVLTLLQPTSPFRTFQDIDQAHDCLYEDGCVISAYQSDKFFWGIDTSDGDQDFVPIGHNPMFRPGRQDRDNQEKLFVENGAIYVADADSFARYGTYRIPPYTHYLMSQERSLDIDSPEDWEACELYLPKFLEYESSLSKIGKSR